MPITVVTDSSSRLHPDELQRWGIEQVPLHLLVDGQDLRDGIDQVPYDVYTRAHVTTAGAAPAEVTPALRAVMGLDRRQAIEWLLTNFDRLDRSELVQVFGAWLRPPGSPARASVSAR